MSARHALSGAEAATICRQLERRDIPVLVAVDEAQVVHLYPQRPVDTREEVAVLGAFLAVTDARLAWHGAVAS